MEVKVVTKSKKEFFGKARAIGNESLVLHCSKVPITSGIIIGSKVDIFIEDKKIKGEISFVRLMDEVILGIKIIKEDLDV